MYLVFRIRSNCPDPYPTKKCHKTRSKYNKIYYIYLLLFTVLRGKRNNKLGMKHSKLIFLTKKILNTKFKKERKNYYFKNLPIFYIKKPESQHCLYRPVFVLYGSVTGSSVKSEYGYGSSLFLYPV